MSTVQLMEKFLQCLTWMWHKISLIGDSVQQYQICHKKRSKTRKCLPKEVNKTAKIITRCSKLHPLLLSSIMIIDIFHGGMLEEKWWPSNHMTQQVTIKCLDITVLHRFEDLVDCPPKCQPMSWRDQVKWHDDEEVLRNFLSAALYHRQTFSWLKETRKHWMQYPTRILKQHLMTSQLQIPSLE